MTWSLHESASLAISSLLADWSCMPAPLPTSAAPQGVPLDWAAHAAWSLLSGWWYSGYFGNSALHWLDYVGMAFLLGSSALFGLGMRGTFDSPRSSVPRPGLLGRDPPLVGIVCGLALVPSGIIVWLGLACSWV